MKAYVKAINYYLPETVVSNEDLVREFPEWNVEKIASKVGINRRYITANDETATDMAIAAAKKLFEDNTVNKEDIDFILFCTQSPDYILPTSACLIQHQLGLSSQCGALDFNLGCSGYIYGLALAKGLICGGIARNVLLLTGETYSKHLHPKDKSNRTIFGDAATATIVCIEEGIAEILDFSLGTNGAGGNNLIIKNGGCRFPEKANDLVFDDNNNPISSDYLYMNGSEIFNFTIDVVPSLTEDILVKNTLKQDDISLFVFHQANKYMLNFLRKKLKISEERFYYFMSEVGNTVSSTVPIALTEAYKENRLHGKIMIGGFGVGYSWGGTILNFE